MFSKLTVSVVALVATLVGAQTTTWQANNPNADGLKITLPNSEAWWVQGNENVLAWTCRNTGLGPYLISFVNADPAILNGAQLFRANVANADCSIIIQPTQFTPAPGYQIVISNNVNLTDIYAVSQPFEIKPLGAAYPVITTTDIGTAPTAAGASSASSGANPSQTGSSSAAGRMACAPIGVVGAIAAATLFF